MLSMQDILKLPLDEQLAIMKAIQDNLDDFETDENLNEHHSAFTKECINSNEPEYTWEQIKDLLIERWNNR